ncbi:hypothetical protein [Ethanoligenens sp.]|uniref:hypothetical protein n=1 Tax=Ethanoligenens sp. TaxID=2099655 RepID=UPI0039ED29B5
MRKVYVKVNADHFTNGMVLPRSFQWEDGTSYEIDRVIDRCRAASTKVGGVGWRYKVRIYGKEKFMWLEDGGRWFMEGILP